MKKAIEIVFRPIGELVADARNARTHSDEQVGQLAASIAEFGFTNPVLIAADGGIIAGHGRVMAAQQLGMEEVPTLVLGHLNETQRRAYLIADNRLALNAGWDADLLASEMALLDGEGFDLSLLGFEPDELESLLASAESQVGLVDEDEVPEVQRGPAVTQPGNLWLLGRHRLLCGSCAERQDVLRVMAGERASVCLSDPPYGLDGQAESGKGDYEGYDDSQANLKALAALWLPLAREIAPVVVFSCGVTNQWLYPQPDWVMCWFYGGGPLSSPWGFCCWQPFLCYGQEPGLASGNGRRPDAVDLNVPANAADIDHPCPKPVRLWEWFIERLVFTPRAVLYEPFCGSGTALVAASKRGGLSVRAIELVPHYVDVAVRRWQAFSGEQARLEDGRTFDEVAAAATPEEVT